MKVSKMRLKKIIRESVWALRKYDAPSTDIDGAIEGLCEAFRAEMMDLFWKDPDAFEGRSSKAEWTRAVYGACDRLRDEVAAIVTSVEEDLHGGEF